MFQHKDMVVSEVMRSIADMVDPKVALTIDPVSCTLLKVSTLDINWRLWPRAFRVKAWSLSNMLSS